MQRFDRDTIVHDWLFLEQETGNVDDEVHVDKLTPDEQFERLRTLWSLPRWDLDSLSLA